VGRTGFAQNKTAAISISCVRTVHAHTVCFGRTLTSRIFWIREVFLGQCPPVSDCVCVNSRTPDIGKACGLILCETLVVGV
jgi:hypothetical protein